MTTINKEEIQKFSKMADEWWDTSGKFKPLHMFNPVRIEYILEKICEYYKLSEKKSFPLEKIKIFAFKLTFSKKEKAFHQKHNSS